MFGFLLFLFAFLSKCIESELPFEDEDENDEPPVLEDDVNQDEDNQDEDALDDEEIKKNEKEIKASPTPTPAPENIPIKDLIGLKEIIVACGMVF